MSRFAKVHSLSGGAPGATEVFIDLESIVLVQPYTSSGSPALLIALATGAPLNQVQIVDPGEITMIHQFIGGRMHCTPPTLMT